MIAKVINLIKSNIAMKAGVGYVVGNFFIKGITFFSIPLFTRLMTPDQFGIYNIYLAYEMIATIFVGLSLNASIRSAYFDFKEDFFHYISSVTEIILILCGIFMFSILVFKETIVRLTGFPLLILIVLMLHSTGDAVLSVYNAYLSVRYDYKKYVTLSFLYCLSNLGLSIFLIKTIFSNCTSYGRIYGSAIPLIVIGTFLCLFLLHSGIIVYKKLYWKYALSYSLPILPHALSQVLLTQFNRVVIQKYCNNTVTGLFSFAALFNNVLLVIADSVNYSYATWLYENLEQKKIKNIRKVSSIYIWGFSTIISAMLLVITEVINLIAPASYHRAVFAAIPLVLSAYFLIIYTLPSQIEYYYKKTKYISYGTVLATMVNIVLSLILVPRLGYLIAAYINLISYMLYFFFHYYIAYSINHKSYFETNELMIAIISCLGIGIISHVCLEQALLRWAVMICTITHGICKISKLFKEIQNLEEKYI